MKVSVIIPALNEENSIGRAIGSVFNRAGTNPVDVIVSDGGSVDSTVRKSLALGARVVTEECGRGAQMDAAAFKAEGNVLLFLHADTLLPPNWYEAVRECLKDEKICGGAFTLSIGSEKIWARFIEKAAGFRAKRLGVVYGDQAIFARRHAFFKAGGFKGLPLMEDMDFFCRLKTLGKVCILDEKVETSPRRWQKKGVAANTVKNIFFLFLYRIGVSPQRLCRWYYGV